MATMFNRPPRATKVLEFVCEICERTFYRYPSEVYSYVACSERCRDLLRPSKRKVKPEEEIISQFWSKVNKTSGLGPNGDCWEYTGYISPYGYGKFWHYNQLKYLSAHRFSFQLAGKFIKNDDLCHTCDNRKCVNPDHLFEGNTLINNLDKQLKGRASKKLTADVVKIIKFERKLFTNVEIAKEFGINKETVACIRRGTSWKHITEDYEV